MKSKSRLQETRELLAEYGLFAPDSKGAREAIRLFVHQGNKYGRGGRTPAERVAGLKEITSELRGKFMVHKMVAEKQIVFKVCHVLPKTEWEVENTGLSPYKVCVESSVSRKPYTIFLDELVLVGSDVTQRVK